MAMSWRTREDGINAWWEGVPRERFWLDVTGRAGREAILAAPRGEGRQSTAWTHRLITYVKGGDVVFHYDSSQEAIIAWSVAHGRVEKQRLPWPSPSASTGAGSTHELLPSWGIPLQRSTTLDVALPLQEIARTQWSFFPSLRALEDEVGYPLYYPFEMGNREATRPLPGYVFKLPAVFVQGFSELANAARRVDRVLALPPSAPSQVRTPAPRTRAASG